MGIARHGFSKYKQFIHILMIAPVFIKYFIYIFKEKLP